MDRDDSLADAYSNSSSSESGIPTVAKYLLILVVLILLSMIAGGIIAMGLTTDTVDTEQPTQVSGTDYTTLYNNTQPSVVSIHITTQSGESVQGTGFVYQNGYILTNHHVTQNADTIYIQYAEGQWSKATTVGSDPYTDLSVLDPARKPNYADPLTIETQLPERGEKVAVIGSPDGLRGTITTGVVSGTGRSMRTGNGFVIPDMIQTDSPLNPGNSGGPLVNSDGEVVGIVNARQGENIGFAVSSRLVDEVVSEIIQNGEPVHPYLGVESISLTPEIADANNVSTTDGVIITGTANNTNSNDVFNSATIKEKNSKRIPVGGDIIVAIDGHPVKDGEDLGSYLLRKTEPGETVEVTVLRDGERKTVEVELSRRPTL